MADEKRPAYGRRREYRELKRSLMDALAVRGVDEEVYRDKVQDDIARRGLTITDERGRMTENRSVSLEIQVSRQMLAIFTTLGFKEGALASGRSEDDDEL